MVDEWRRWWTKPLATEKAADAAVLQHDGGRAAMAKEAKPAEGSANLPPHLQPRPIYTTIDETIALAKAMMEDQEIKIIISRVKGDKFLGQKRI